MGLAVVHTEILTYSLSDRLPIRQIGRKKTDVIINIQIGIEMNKRNDRQLEGQTEIRTALHYGA